MPAADSSREISAFVHPRRDHSKHHSCNSSPVKADVFRCVLTSRVGINAAYASSWDVAHSVFRTIYFPRWVYMISPASSSATTDHATCQCRRRLQAMLGRHPECRRGVRRRQPRRRGRLRRKLQAGEPAALCMRQRHHVWANNVLPGQDQPHYEPEGLRLRRAGVGQHRLQHQQRLQVCFDVFFGSSCAR